MIESHAETLRKYPPVTNLIRSTQHNYGVSNTNYIIEKGTQIWIPAYAIQNDPEFYPEPDKFNPDRFAPEEVAIRDSVLWLPFGEGPRNCIGLRFGMMQVRVGLIAMLKDFEFCLSEKTNVPLQYSSSGVILSPKGGVWLHLKRRIE